MYNLEVIVFIRMCVKVEIVLSFDIRFIIFCLSGFFLYLVLG